MKLKIPTNSRDNPNDTFSPKDDNLQQRYQVPQRIPYTFYYHTELFPREPPLRILKQILSSNEFFSLSLTPFIQ